MPHISSFGTVPCMIKLKHRSTQGRYGALNTSSPKKLSKVSGFLRLQMYMRVLLRAEPRNAMENMGAMQRRSVEAKVSSHEKWAGERPDDSSRRRE
jgi:hypothetical protein